MQTYVVIGTIGFCFSTKPELVLFFIGFLDSGFGPTGASEDSGGSVLTEEGVVRGCGGSVFGASGFVVSGFGFSVPGCVCMTGIFRVVIGAGSVAGGFVFGGVGFLVVFSWGFVVGIVFSVVVVFKVDTVSVDDISIKTIYFLSQTMIYWYNDILIPPLSLSLRYLSILWKHINHTVIYLFTRGHKEMANKQD